MGKKGAFVFVLFFLLVCLLPGVATLALGESGPAANEVLTAKPQLKKPDGTFNTAFFSDAGDYFSDHFALRQELITGNSLLRAQVFRTSVQKKVALGQDGWLFYAETLDDYTGADLLTEEEAQKVAKNLKQAQDYAESQGVKFLFTIAPNKLSLYPEYGPAGLVRADETSADRVKKYLEAEGVNYLDLFSLFDAQEEVLYHQLDSHWTNKGAALARDALMEQLGLPAESAWEKGGSYVPSHQGDLYTMLYPASRKLDRQWEFAESLDFTYDKPIRSAEDMRISTSSGSENGSLLMFRDSFGNAWHPLLAECFSSALFTRAVPYDLTLAEESGADVIVLEIVERNLSRLAEDCFVLE